MLRPSTLIPSHANTSFFSKHKSMNTISSSTTAMYTQAIPSNKTIGRSFAGLIHSARRWAMCVSMIMVMMLSAGLSWGQTPNGFLDFGNLADGTTATIANTGFGGVRVGTGGGSLTLANPGQAIGSLGELKGVAPSTGSINSVGVTSAEYGTAATTFTTSFELHLSGGSSGIWYFFAGNGTSFGSAQSSGFTGNQVFSGIRWTFGASNIISTDNRSAGSWVAMSGTPFAQNTSYFVTIVGNNSASTVSYGASQSVAANTYDLWVNGTLVGNDLAKGQLPAATNINAFRFYGENSTGNVATIAIDNIRWYNTCVLPPTHLAFDGFPATGTVGTNLASFNVEARSGSESGPIATAFTGTITLTKATGSGNLSGSLAPSAVSGIATYSDIQLDAADNYTLTSSAAAPIISSTSSSVTISAPVLQDPFITTWKTDNFGASNSTSIFIPTTGGGYSYDVDWTNDGIFDDFGVTGDILHDYGVAGTYTVAIRGAFPRIYFNNGGDCQKITNIGQWGNNVWTSMENAFYGCRNLNSNATDAPDLTGVTNMGRMFQYGESFNGDISAWNVSAVTNMFAMFYNATIFNQDISTWNVSNVTDMSYMFGATGSFNQPIGIWNVGNVTNMKAMFYSSNFNQPINGWDVSKVTNMNEMFYEALLFNQPLNGWDVSKVTNMGYMFQSAALFNQPLDNWVVSNVTNMEFMFRSANVFNSDISTWDVANVTNMNYMFFHADDFNGDLSAWDVSSVTNMGYMFDYATAFNSDISGWNVSNVTNMSAMFAYAPAFNSNISTWDVGKVTKMDYMFWEADAFNQPIGGWNVSLVTDMQQMFRGTDAFNQDIGAWNVGLVSSMAFMFSGTAVFNQDISNWNVSNVTTMSYMFSGAGAFNKPLGTWNVSNVINMPYMFYGATTFNRNLRNWTLNSSVYLASMLDGSGIDCYNYSATLIGWSATGPYGRILGAAGLLYGTNAVAAHTNLITTKSWTIAGDGPSGIDCSMPLPISLLSFYGKSTSCDNIVLTWITSAEKDNAYFEIWRGTKAEEFAPIGRVQASNTIKGSSYSFIDDSDLKTGENYYYKIKQVDFNGAVEIFNIISIRNNCKNTVPEIVIYPNPASDIIHVSFSGIEENQKTELVFINALGMVVKKLVINNIDTENIDISDLPSGIFNIHTLNLSENLNLKFVHFK